MKPDERDVDTALLEPHHRRDDYRGEPLSDHDDARLARCA